MSHLKLILLVTSFILPLALSFTILAQSGKSMAKKVMVFGLLNAGLAFLFNYFYFEKIFAVYTLTHSLHITTVLWLFPSVYLYIRAFILDKNVLWYDFKHLLPGALFGLISALLFYGLLNGSERIYYLNTYRSGIDYPDLRLKAVYLFRLTDVGLIAVQVIYYSILLVRLPHCYQEKLQEEFSNIENFSLSWIKWFNLSFVVVGALCIMYYVFNPYSMSNELFLIFFLFLIALFIWMIGIISLRQQRPNIDLEILQCETSEPQKTDTIHDEVLAQKLIDFIEKQQAFLQPELSLTMVCKELNTNRTYLSALINQQVNMNFNAFVNQYRVKYISEYSKNNPGKSKEELALIGGFGSLSSMKRALKREEMDI